jgi:hypothetical protein
MWPRRASQRTLADSDTAFIRDHHDVADVQIAPNDTPGLSIRTQSGEWIDAPNSPSTPKPDVTSHANSHYQKRFDKLAELAAASEWTRWPPTSATASTATPR